MMLERYACYLYFKQGMTPVSICLYIAFSYEAANDWLQERQLVNNNDEGRVYQADEITLCGGLNYSLFWCIDINYFLCYTVFMVRK